MPGRSHPVADAGDDARVNRRSDEAEDPESQRGHARKPGDHGGERADEGQRPPERDGPRPAAGQELLRPVDVAARDEQVLASVLDERALRDAADAVGDKGPDDLGDRAENDHERQAQVTLVGQHPGKPEGDLGRDRDAARLQEAEQHQGGVPVVGEKRVQGCPLARRCQARGLHSLLHGCRYITGPQRRPRRNPPASPAGSSPAPRRRSS